MPPQVSSRTHCVYWPDWASNAKVELARGIRMDANYYHYPGPWIGAKPGFMNGGGFPMRFADLDGTRDRRLPAEHEPDRRVDDELRDLDRGAARQRRRRRRVLRRLRREHAHGRAAPHPGAEAIVAAALARSVPVISYKQLLDLGGRPQQLDRSAASRWNAGTLTFVTTVGAGANGLQTMLPVQGPAGTLTGITRAGSPVPLHGADDQGRAVRSVHRRHGHVPGDLRVGDTPPVG